MQKKYEILMEAKKRFKFYTTTVMRVEMKHSYQHKGLWKFYIVWMKKQCSLKYNYCRAPQVSNTVKQCLYVKFLERKLNSPTVTNSMFAVMSTIGILRDKEG